MADRAAFKKGIIVNAYDSDHHPLQPVKNGVKPAAKPEDSGDDDEDNDSEEESKDGAEVFFIYYLDALSFSECFSFFYIDLFAKNRELFVQVSGSFVFTRWRK